MKIRLVGIIISIGIIGFFSTANAQQLISTAGSFYYTNEFSLIWSIGEPITQTLPDKDYYFTQGFHQPIGVTSSVEILLADKHTCNIYPNPVTKNLFVDLQKEYNLPILFQLYDPLGKLVLFGKFDNLQNQIEMSSLLKGIYLLLISNEKTGISLLKMRILKQ